MGTEDTVPVEEMVPFPTGTTLGRIRLDKVIGAGGMGTVYLAHHEALDKTVAVKVLPRRYSANSEYVRRFQREARSAAKLEHPNIIQILDVAHDGDVHFIVMQYYEGMDLQRLIDKKGKVSVNDALSITKKVAQALSAAHKAGIVHRDIKPSNIVITKQGKVLVTDFGLAREIQGTMTGSNITQSGGIVLGTPQFISPEQAMGERSDARSDIYSLGATMYCMLAGKPPYNDDNPVAVLMKHVRDNEQPPPLRKITPDVPEQVEKMITRMMAKQPSQRISSMDDIIAQIDLVKGTRGTGTVGMAKVPRKTPWLPIAIGIAIGIVGMIIILVLVLASSASKELRAAVELEQDAENDPIKLREAESKFRDIIARYPVSEQATLAKKHIAEIEQRMDLIDAGVSVKGIRERYLKTDLTFAVAFRDLTKLHDRKLSTGLTKAIDDALDEMARVEVERNVAKLGDALKSRAASRIVDLIDPEQVEKFPDHDRTGRMLLYFGIQKKFPPGIRVKTFDPVPLSMKVERAKSEARVDCTVVVDDAEVPPHTFTLKWKFIRDGWYLPFPSEEKKPN